MFFSDRAVSLQKQFVVFLFVMVLMGTIFNWTMKTQEHHLVKIQKHADIRVQQVKDEYVRKLQESEELFQQSWAKHTKEMEIQCEENFKSLQKETEQITIAINSSKVRETELLQEKNEKLALENEDLLRKLKNMTHYFESNKSESNQLLKESIADEHSDDSLEQNQITPNSVDHVPFNNEATTNNQAEIKVVEVKSLREDQT